LSAAAAIRKLPMAPILTLVSFVTLRNRRPTLLRASAYRTPSEASPRRRCGHASQFLCLKRDSNSCHSPQLVKRSSKKSVINASKNGNENRFRENEPENAILTRAIWPSWGGGTRGRGGIESWSSDEGRPRNVRRVIYIYNIYVSSLPCGLTLLTRAIRPSWSSGRARTA